MPIAAAVIGGIKLGKKFGIFGGKPDPRDPCFSLAAFEDMRPGGFGPIIRAAVKKELGGTSLGEQRALYEMWYRTCRQLMPQHGITSENRRTRAASLMRKAAWDQTKAALATGHARPASPTSQDQLDTQTSATGFNNGKNDGGVLGAGFSGSSATGVVLMLGLLGVAFVAFRSFK